MAITRTFTLDQANAVLPELEMIFYRLLSRKEAVARLHDELLLKELVTTRAEENPDEFLKLEEEAKAVDHVAGSLEQEIQRVLSLGCVIRNLESGCVDFPGERNGEPVYFCWKRGEKAVAYYHSRKGSLTERYLI